MAHRTSRCSGDTSPEAATVLRRLRFLARLFLLVGIVASSILTSLQAQPGPFVEKKAEVAPKEKRKTVEKKESFPSPAVPQSVPLPAMAGGAKSGDPAAPPHRFHIEPNTPLKELLPPAPKEARIAGPLTGNDLSRVPEVQFEAPQGAVGAAALQRIAHQMAKINHLNDKNTDSFIEALRSQRSDLGGLPFAMGDKCRTKGERSKQLAIAVATVRQALQPSIAPITFTNEPTPSGSGPLPAGPGGPPGMGGRASDTRPVVVNLRVTSQTVVDPASPETFWQQYQTLCSQQDKAQARRQHRETVILARIAALSQILMPMAEMHSGLVKYLSTISHVEATQALARLALFSREEDARKAAIDALKVRRERDYTDILVHGLRYPWPAVARRAAEAIVKLERNDLLPQLLDMLEQPDPRAPVMQQVKEKRVPVVREMVRLNHHRSCLLCHAPGNTGKVSGDAVKAEVPVPGQPLNPPTGPYSSSRQDILVRVDVTYLRQDFSVLQAVADANPWPEMQRFDFLVRERVLSEDEAAAYRDKLKPREPGEFSPYQRASLAALRELTGRDTEPTPKAWRKLLKLPTDSHRKTATP